MKSVYNLVGDTKALIANLYTGAVSPEAAQIQIAYFYYMVDQSGTRWLFNDTGVTVFEGCPLGTFNWDGTSLQFARPQVQTQGGAQDSKATIVCAPNIDAYDNVNATAQTFFAGMQDGLFDGTFMIVYKRIYSPPLVIKGMVVEFAGWIGQTTCVAEKMTIELNSVFQMANLRLPKRPYGPACTHALYDAGCGVSQAAFTFLLSVGIVDPTLPQQVIHAASSGLQAQYCQLGALTFTTGLNAGLLRSIKFDNGSVFTVIPRFPFIPTPGDLFTVTAGCDKTLATCVNKFNNFYNFNGFPFIPDETVFG